MVIEKILKTALVSSLSIIITSCNNKAETSSASSEWIKKEGQHIVISENNPVLKKIQVKPVIQQPSYHDISSVGLIEAIPNNYAEIASPFSGRIVKSYVQIGDKVSAGSPLFEVLSSDYLSVQKEYAQALNESQLAEKKFTRQKDLEKHGVGIQKDLEESETEFKNAKNSLANLSSALKVYNSTTGKNLLVRSPISGNVTSSKIVSGHYLKDDAEPVITIAELSKVWISGEVKEKDIRFIKTGDAVSIQVNSFPDTPITGKVYHINDQIDENTKSLRVLIECDNPMKRLKPGMFASITYATNPEESIVIPERAVMQDGIEQYVWIKTGKNKFRRQNIVTKELSDKDVKVVSGLHPGDSIIVAGSIYLLDSL
ncbi:efflux RND transporter periplasmic adaptor subunit [Chryseobacterium sp. MYb264]|uniref:efflux RND transporter periplasmic adaptor subunit n=1 Tax=Chryseobacterium sp. MYb264 TaxID=2745153 RepID=UPI002E0E66FA|nr:efflux RND transporter periplasmic adaptor subunit [Chryseobacterium sp. MYb264]